MKALGVCANLALYSMLACGLSACSSAPEKKAAASFSSGHVIIRNGFDVPPSPESLNDIQTAAGDARRGSMSESYEALAYDDSAPPSHCRLKDRFDRKELIAYHFADGKTRLGLKVDMDGFGLSDMGGFDMQGALVNFRYRFQAIKKPREKCLYQSSWQGLLGSGYNELVEREDYTVYEELDQEVNRMHRKVEKLFSY